MKKLILASLSLSLLCVGCGTAGGIYAAQETVTPQIVETIKTNEVVQLVTDQGGVIVATNVSFAVEKSYATNLFTNTTYSTSAATLSAIAVGSAIAPAVPQPWGGLASAALACLAGILGIVAKVKSDKAAIVPALIQAVEIANDPNVKSLITSHATAAGVEDALNAAVIKLTK